MPTHITEALRSNMSGGKTVAQLLAEAAAAVPFMSLAELKARVEAAERSRSTSQGQGIQVEPHRGGRTAERWLLLCDSPARFEAECHDMSHQG